MPNEMRPCTLWGETFDAMDARICEINMRGKSLNFEVWVEVWDAEKSISIKKCFTDNEIKIAQRQAITAIAEALDAPVLATEEVLAGLPKDAKVILTDIGDLDLADTPYACMTSIGYISIFVEDFTQKVYIKSNGCHKTAEYLRQFTLDGVRFKEKETSHE